MSPKPVAENPESALRPRIAWRLSDWLLCGGLLVFGLLLRVPLLVEPLWVDELHTGWVVADGLDSLPERARQGNQSPLWFALPWLTTRVTLAAWTLRLPSLVAGLASLVLTFVLARRVAGRTLAALAAMWLVVCDPQWAFYATEARAYACVQLLALLHWAAWQSIGSPPSDLSGEHDAKQRLGWRAAWIATAVVLFYVHYTTALVVVAEWLADVFLLARASSRVCWRQRTIDYSLVLLACLPAWGELRTIAAHRDDWSQSLAAASPWTIFPWLTAVIIPAAIGGMVAVGARLVASRRMSSSPWQPRLDLIVQLVAWIAIPVVIATLATWTDAAQLLRFRYLLGAAAILPLATATIVSMQSRPLARSCVLLAILVLPVLHHESLQAWLHSGRWPAERREDWRTLVAQLDRDPPSDGRPLLLCPALVEDRHLVADATPLASDELTEFCRFPLRSLYRLSDADHAGARELWPLATVESPRLSISQKRTIRDAQGCQLIVRGDEELAEWIAKELVAELRPARCRVVRKPTASTSGLQLLDFTVRP